MEVTDALEKLQRDLAHAEAERKRLSAVDALLNTVDVSLAANKVGNERAVVLGRLRDNLTSESYHRLCAAIQAALDAQR
jgi:hypothetical protein